MDLICCLAGCSGGQQERQHLRCQHPDGNVFIVDEHAERLWLPQRHAAAIKAMLARHGVAVERLKRFVAGADMFSKQSDGSTVAAQYARQGITLRVANTDRVSKGCCGWKPRCGGCAARRRRQPRWPRMWFGGRGRCSDC